MPNQYSHLWNRSNLSISPASTFWKKSWRGPSAHIMVILYAGWPKTEKGVHVHGRLVWPVQLSVPSSLWFSSSSCSSSSSWSSSSSSQKQCSQCSRSAGPSDHQHWLESGFLCDATPEKQTNNRSTIGPHFFGASVFVFLSAPKEQANNLNSTATQKRHKTIKSSLLLWESDCLSKKQTSESIFSYSSWLFYK